MRIGRIRQGHGEPDIKTERKDRLLRLRRGMHIWRPQFPRPAQWGAHHPCECSGDSPYLRHETEFVLSKSGGNDKALASTTCRDAGFIFALYLNGRTSRLSSPSQEELPLQHNILLDNIKRLLTRRRRRKRDRRPSSFSLSVASSISDVTPIILLIALESQQTK